MIVNIKQSRRKCWNTSDDKQQPESWLQCLTGLVYHNCPIFARVNFSPSRKGIFLCLTNYRLLFLSVATLSAQFPNVRCSCIRPFVLYPVERVADIFHIGQTQARQTFKELESAGLIVRVQQGCGKPSRIYIPEVTDGKPTVKTDGKPTVKTDGKPTVKTDGKPLTSHQKESNNISQEKESLSGGETREICENQQTFDDLFLMMTVKDVVAEILCQLVAKNPQEFAEINAEIIDFVAENIRKAAENKKIANLRGYARQALRHGRADFDAAQKRPEPPKKATTGYAATYNIAEYERYGIFDNYFYFDTLPPVLSDFKDRLMYKHRLYVKDLSPDELARVRSVAGEPHCEDDNL